MTATDDYIEQLGTLALASRLRRLLNKMVADGDKIYRELDFPFKVKWFPILHLLENRSPLALTRIAKILDLSHPSVIEVTKDLAREKLIASKVCATDKRSRELSLTPKGKRLCSKLKPIWEAFGKAGEEVNTESGDNFLKAISKIEAAIDKKPMYDRITAILKNSADQKRRTKK